MMVSTSRSATLVNLRGVVDAGRLFALPTYLFVGSFIVILLLGGYAAVTSGGHPHALVAPPAPPPAVEAVGLWLLLRAFASGCTAMTGVEAVSNGVSVFREPRVSVARQTLAIIVVTLAFLLGGIAYVASAYGIAAMDQQQPGYQSVLSQLAAAIVVALSIMSLSPAHSPSSACPPTRASSAFRSSADWWRRTATCRVRLPLWAVASFFRSVSSISR